MSEPTPSQNEKSIEPSSTTSNMLSWVTTKTKHASGALASSAAPLFFACFCLALAYKNITRKKPDDGGHRRFLQRSVSMAALHGGNVALQRILDSQEARVDEAGLTDAEKRFETLLRQDSPKFSELQKEAAKLEMSGKEQKAIRMLRKELENAKNTKRPHEAHEFEMLLVEMLIYEGDYETALKCKCLDDKEISDARGPLYKAVIYALLNRSEADSKDCKQCYEEFQNVRSRFYGSGSFEESPLNEVMHDFEKFKRIVSKLKQEIEDAHKAK